MAFQLLAHKFLADCVRLPLLLSSIPRYLYVVTHSISWSPILWWIIVYFNTHSSFSVDNFKNINTNKSHGMSCKMWNNRVVIWYSIGMMLPTSGRFRDDSGTYKISTTQKSEFVKYLKTTFIRRLNAHNLRYQKQDRFWIGWFRIWQLKLTAQPVNCAKCFLKVSARLVTVLLNDWCEI